MLKSATPVDYQNGKTLSLRRIGWRHLVLYCLALLVSGIFAARNIATWPARLAYPGAEDTVEAVSLAQMVRLGAGIPIYAQARPGEFDSANYGPLYYLLGSHLVYPHGPAYLRLRVFSLLATLGCAGAAGLLAWWLSGSPFAAALAPLLFLSFAHLAMISVSDRADMPALFLVFMGFLLASRFRRSGTILLACPLLAFGLFYKQQFLAAPAAILLFLLVEKQYHRAARFTATLVFCGLGILALLDVVVFPGQSLLLHLIRYNLLPFSLRRLGIFSIYVVATILPVLLAAIDSLRVHRDGLLTCYLGCSVCLALLMVAKEGSALGYFVEPVLIISPLLAALVAHRLRLGSVPDTITLLVLIGLTLWVGDWKVEHPYPRPRDFNDDRQEQAFLRREFPPGSAALTLGVDVTRAGLSTPISDIFQYSWLVCEGRIPEPDLVGLIRNQRFAVITLQVDLRSDAAAHSEYWCLSEAVRRAILENYEVKAEFPSGFPHQIGPRDYAWVPLRPADAAPSLGRL